MLVDAKTDIGLLRQTNEDSYVCVDSKFYIVADGMGGHVAGEVASKLVVDTVREFLYQAELAGSIDENSLMKAISLANQVIFEKAEHNEQYKGMGTTISMVYFIENKCLWAHVGDSRIYIYRNQKLSQITEDHSLVWNLVASGSITEEEAASHPQRNMLTRAVGVDADVEVDTGQLEIYKDDVFLLCSDGLTNMVDNEKIKEIIYAPAFDGVAGKLIDAALHAGGADNITAIIIKV